MRWKLSYPKFHNYFSIRRNKRIRGRGGEDSKDKKKVKLQILLKRLSKGECIVIPDIKMYHIINSNLGGMLLKIDIAH